MKKMLLFICLFVFFVSILNVSFATTTLIPKCNVSSSHSISVTGSAGYRYEKHSSTQHIKYSRSQYLCAQCNAYGICDTAYDIVNHTYTYTDLGHIDNPNPDVMDQHQFRAYCGLCTYSKTFYTSCSGNPCVQPNHIKPIMVEK